MYRPQKKNSYTGWIIAMVVLIGATLPFHYIPTELMVFPKENLTFSNTIIMQEDIDEIVKRYNEASFFEQQAINQEPFIRKLRAKGIIVNNDDSTEENEE